MPSMRFSQRKGLRPVRQVMQKDGIDNELRNTLWNALDLFVWRREHFLQAPFGAEPEIEDFSIALWLGYFKHTIDSRPDNPWGILQVIRDYFFSRPWFEVYDFLEFVLNHLDNKELVGAINDVLQRELSAYRFVGGVFTDITDEEEISALELALADTDFPGVRSHLRRALELLSDRENPDYRNSIKESISAVESLSRSITGSDKATLGDALKVLERRGQLHPALKEGFVKLYGYTSDEQGVRHSMLDEPNLTADDAKFWLIACTTFVNYLKSRI